MSELELRVLGHADEARMHAVNRACPIEADFTFFFERSPGFFLWPEAVFDEHVYIGGFLRGELVAYVLFAKVRGCAGPLGESFSYMGDARVLPEARGHAFMDEATRALLSFVSPEPAGFALVKRGNRAAREAASKMHLSGMSKVELCAFDAASVLLLRPTGGARRFRVRHATDEDVPRLAALMQRAFEGRLFAPVVSEDELRSDAVRLPGFGIGRYYLAFAGGELVGALGAWDAHSVRRISVLRLSWRARLLRAAYAGARCVLRSGAPLPRAGQAFHAITTTRLAVPSGDPDILHDLVVTAHDEHLGRGYHMLLVGLTGDEPLAPGLRGMLVQHFRSDVLLFAPAQNMSVLESTRRPYIDLRFI